MQPLIRNNLSAVSLFHKLTDAQLDQVILAARSRVLQTGEFLYQQGDPATHVYLLLQGRIRLSQVTVEGQQVILRYAAPGEAFGIVALLSKRTYPVSAESVEMCELVGWEQETLNKLMVSIPMIAINAIGLLVNRIFEFQDKIRELSTERVERRIARTLLRLANQTGRKTSDGILIDLPLSRQDLAEMNGTTLYTVSRTLSAWESKGIIQSRREQVVITSAHGLVSIAEDLPSRSP